VTRGRPLPVVWLFLLGAAAATVFFYRDFIFHPARLLFGSDMLLEGFPLRQFLVDEVRAGRGVPRWTPHVYGGMPYVGLLPGPVFYPTTLLYFVMPLYRAIGWTFVLHTFLAAGFGYFLGRAFRLRPWAAAVCGTSFMLTGYVTSLLFGGHDGRMFAMILFPLAFGLLERGLRGGEVRWFCGLALVVGAQAVTPHTQILYFSALALALYVAFHLVTRARAEGEGIGRFARPAGLFLGAMVAGGAVGAIQLLPTLDLLGHVTRQATETGYPFASSFALPPQELTAFFLPDLIGSLPGSYWGANGIKLHTEYLGAVPLTLALLGIAASFGTALDTDGRRAARFLAGASVLGILFALGAVTPIHRIAYAVLPMIASFRAPAMMLGPVVVFVALLAGFGWEAVLRARAEGTGLRAGISSMWLGVLAAPVVLLGMWAALDPGGLQGWALHAWYPEGWPRVPPPQLAGALRSTALVLLAGAGLSIAVGVAVAGRRLAEAGVVVLLVFTLLDLGRVDARYRLTDDAAAQLSPDPVIEALEADAGPGVRIWAIQLEQPMYRPNRFMYYGLSSVTGSQKFILEPYARLVDGVRPDDALYRYGASLVPLLDVRYLITRTEQPAGALAPMAESEGRLLYRVAVPIPHAFFPGSVVPVGSLDEAVERTRNNVQPLDTAFVEVDPPGSPGGSDGPPSAGAGSATISRYEPDTVELEVQADAPGLLFVSEIHHPGWRASIDGEDAGIWRVNAAFRGVEVPAGSHVVTFRYVDRGYRAGRWLSMISVVGLVGALGVGWWRSRA